MIDLLVFGEEKHAMSINENRNIIGLSEESTRKLMDKADTLKLLKDITMKH